MSLDKEIDGIEGQIDVVLDRISPEVRKIYNELQRVARNVDRSAVTETQIDRLQLCCVKVIGLAGPELNEIKQLADELFGPSARRKR